MRQSELDRRDGSDLQVLRQRLLRSSAESLAQCVYCQESRFEELLDLGSQPLANGLLHSNLQPEFIYPLRLVQCKACQLIQRETTLEIPIFDHEYPYRSSVNTSYVKQCVEWADRFDWKGRSVLEIGSNDGFLVDYLTHKGANAVGVDPCGIGSSRNLKGFFSKDWVNEKRFYGAFDWIIANNVIAHTPRLMSFIQGLKLALSRKPGSRISIEFPEFSKLVYSLDVDTVYHEHFSYFTLENLSHLMGKHELILSSYDEIPSHGGSIRANFTHEGQFMPHAFAPFDFKRLSFQREVMERKHRLLRHVSILSESHRDLIAFGAAAKGISMLNWLGVKSDMVRACVDETKEKQGKWMPGSRIPIVSPDYIQRTRPTAILILPWNFEHEIRTKLSQLIDWDCRIEVLPRA